MATKSSAVSNPEKAKQKPAHEVRLGRIRCTLWANFHDEKGTWYSMTFARSYKDGDEWKNAASFGKDDLLTVAEAARLAWDAEEANLTALSTSCHSQACGQVGLTGARGTNKQNVLPLVEILPFDQFQHERLVDARTGCEVKPIEQLGCGKTGGFEPPLGCLSFTLDQLQLAELQQERQVIGVIGSTALGYLLALRVHGEDLQGLQVMLEQHGALGVDLLARMN